MAVRYLIAAALLTCAAPLCAQEFTAQQLMDKNLEARGGAAALDSLKSISFTGKTIFPGDFELQYKEVRARGPSGPETRVDATIQGLTLVEAYDGRDAWRINPFQGRKDPERMSSDEARSLADAALIDGALQSARHDGSTVQYLGREDFEGTPAYKLKISQKDGDQFTYLLDPDTFLEIKVDETRRIRGAQQTTETELGDYEKVGGVYFPMSIDSWPQGQDDQKQRIMIDTAEANPAIDPAIFAEPNGPAAAAKAAAQPPDASQKNQQPKAAPQPPAKAGMPGKGE